MSNVDWSLENGVAEIRFNRPEQMNALDAETAQGFRDAALAVVVEPEARCIVLAAEGRAFMAGGDLSRFHQSDDPHAALLEVVNPVHEALKALQTARQVVLCSVQGAAAGAGMAVALGADLCLTADDAAFTFAYNRVGAPGDCGATWGLPRLVGMRKAMEIALLSGPIPAADALRLGMVNRVVPLADLTAETAAMARRLADGPPLAQARIKALMRNSGETGYAAQLDAEAEAFGACARPQDFAEALSAFFEKRKPRFTGQ